MNTLSFLACSGILCLFAWKSEPALPPAINRSGVVQKRIEPSEIANPGDAETRQGHARGVNARTAFVECANPVIAFELRRFERPLTERLLQVGITKVRIV